VIRLVVGLDLSLASSGWASHEIGDQYDSFQAHAGLMKTKSSGDDVLAVWLRIREAAQGVLNLVVPQLQAIGRNQSLTVVEWASYGSGGQRMNAMADERSAMRWLVAGTLASHGYAVAKVPPKVRAMYATSNGNAGKAAVVAAMREVFPDVRMRAAGDEADALALMCMGLRFVGAPVDGPPTPKQEQAMSKSAWPEGLI
jgi:hypothetical protein